MSMDAEQSELNVTSLPVLPKSWTWASVSQLGEVITGSTPSKQRPDYFGGSIPFFKPTDLNAGYYVTEFSDSLTESGAKEARLLPPLTVLVTCIGATIGKCGLARVPCATNQQINALVIPEATMLPQWAYWAFCSTWGQRQIISNASATTLPILNKGKFERLLLPVAPLNEQRRIVAKIEELFSDLDAGVAALNRVKANLKRYRASVLKAAVEGRLTKEWRKKNPPKETAQELLERILRERRKKWEESQLAAFAKAGKSSPKNWKDKYKEPVSPDESNLPELPKGWCWATIDQISEVQGGIQKQPKRRPQQNAYPYLRVANVYRNRLDLSEVYLIELFGNELEQLRLETGDLLVVEGNGSIKEIGRSALWNGDIENCVHQNHIIRVRFHNVLSSYINAYWNSPFGNAKVMEAAASTSGLYTLSVSKVSLLPIPLAPLGEQEQIVNDVELRLSLLQAAESQIAANLKRSFRLCQSILKRAFEGKLVPQDPKDEPANVLLTRLKAQSHAVSPQKAKSKIKAKST
jgi:type I restriction enzyme S subunit